MVGIPVGILGNRCPALMGAVEFASDKHLCSVYLLLVEIVSLHLSEKYKDTPAVKLNSSAASYIF